MYKVEKISFENKVRNNTELRYRLLRNINKAFTEGLDGSGEYRYSRIVNKLFEDYIFNEIFYSKDYTIHTERYNERNNMLTVEIYGKVKNKYSEETTIYLDYIAEFTNNNTTLVINLCKFDNKNDDIIVDVPIIKELVIDNITVMNSIFGEENKILKVELTGMISDEHYSDIKDIFRHLPRISVTDNFLDVFMNDLLKNTIDEIYRRNSHSNYKIFVSDIDEYTAEININFAFGDVLAYRCTYDKENHILSIKNIYDVHLPLVIRNFEMEYHLVREEIR